MKPIKNSYPARKRRIQAFFGFRQRPLKEMLRARPPEQRLSTYVKKPGNYRVKAVQSSSKEVQVGTRTETVKDKYGYPLFTREVPVFELRQTGTRLLFKAHKKKSIRATGGSDRGDHKTGTAASRKSVHKAARAGGTRGAKPGREPKKKKK